MAYDSESKDGSDFKIPQTSGNDVYVKYGGGDDCMDDDELKALFDQVLSFFLKEVSVNKNAFRPIPPKLGDGQDADLCKLFLTVRRVGSYELVSETNMWEFVAKECGLEVRLVASLKLIYVKYLKDLDQWLIKGGLQDETMENVEIGVIEKLDLLSHQLDGYGCSESKQVDDEIVGFKDGDKGKCVGIESVYDEGMLSEKKKEGTSGFNQNEGGMNHDEVFSGGDDKIRDNVVKKVRFSMINDEIKRNELSPDNIVKKVGLSVINDDDKRSELSPRNVVKKVELSKIKDHDDDDDDDDEEFSVEDEKQIELSIKNVVDEVIKFGSDNDVALIAKDDDDGDNVQKRKREEESLLLSEVLDWVANAAKDPHDTAFETSQRSSKWRNYTSDQLWKQALLARRALFAELNVDSGNEACLSQKKNQRMHPSMYDDNRSEQTRCSIRTSSAKLCSCPSCIPHSSSRMKRHRTESRKCPLNQSIETTEPDRKYNLGPRYQAEVPAWTGPVFDSDPKWLGTQMWPPPENHNEEHEKGTLVIGQGRQNSCDCLFRGSAECARFHIAENRLKIKMELGDLFYKWKFNQMGEEASLSWEPEEEKRFKNLVVRARQDLGNSNKSRREIMNKFWKGASESLPAKPKQKLVSYYYNVFVLRRRSYQNRVTPKEIDSDNDEEEVGSVGGRFGYEKIHGLSLKCSENMQCRDLES